MWLRGNIEGHIHHSTHTHADANPQDRRFFEAIPQHPIPGAPIGQWDRGIPSSDDSGCEWGREIVPALAPIHLLIQFRIFQVVRVME